MFVVCRTCSSSYHIPDEILGDGACQFRCSQCGRGWELRLPATLTGSASSTRGAPAALERSLRRPAPPTRRLRRLVARLAIPIAAAGLLATSMGAIAARRAIVAAAPATAGVYAAIGLPVNLRGLSIEGVHARLEQSGGGTTLVVEGAIANLRSSETVAPPLRIILRSADSRELYVWTARASKDRLAARERAPFAARLASPPEGARDAVVKFASPEDKIGLDPEGS